MHNCHCLFSAMFANSRCGSSVGMVGGKQGLSLDPPCVQARTIQHEFIHAAGFFHEQERHDRDDYILVAEANIQPCKWFLYVTAS